MTTPQCVECKFFVEDEELSGGPVAPVDERFGTCRRHAPSPVGAGDAIRTGALCKLADYDIYVIDDHETRRDESVKAVWPGVDGEDWCGEFVQR